METSDGRERRLHPRLEGHFNVDLLNMGDDPTYSIDESVVEAEALDISKHGMRIASSYNAPVKSIISVIAYYMGQGSICMCEVVWKREENGRFVYGLYIKSWSQLDRMLEKKLNLIEAEEQKLKNASDQFPTAGAVVTEIVHA
jgi:hypothetical protein